MFENISISEELKTSAKKSAEKDLLEAESALQLITKELENKDAETLKMREYFGWGKKIDEVKERIDTAKKIIEGGLVSRSDIRTVCRKYDLRFLPTIYYVKPIPMNALDDIRKFKESCDKNYVNDIVNETEKKPIVESSTILRVRFDGSVRVMPRFSYYGFIPEYLFVIAPVSHFSRAYEPVAADPVILYQNEDGTYQYVTHFGNDFTWTRRLQGFAKTFAVNFIPGVHGNWDSLRGIE